MEKQHPAVFADKDGTVLANVPYNTNPALMEFIPDTVPALRRITDTGFAIYIVTNQSGIARGITGAADVESALDSLIRTLADEGVPVSGMAYCPHHPDGCVRRYATICRCRKPEPGMILDLAAKDSIDLSRSWMVGDILTDCEAGNRAGARSILLDTGGETGWRVTPYNEPDYITRSWKTVADIVIRSMRTEFNDERSVHGQLGTSWNH